MALLLLPTFAASAGEYDFDLEAFESGSPFELSGYGELRYEHLQLDPDAALYGVNYGSERRDALNRLSETLELEATYRKGDTRLSALLHATARQDESETDEQTRLYQAYIAHQATAQTTLEAGKRTLKWGKGYAWSPVAFLERPKDPLDPELSREGFVLATADLIHSGEGELRTAAFTPVVLPVNGEVNDDFGRDGETNLAAKLYLLYHDIDIDVMYRSAGSRSEAFGLDFATNLKTNLEIHGEWAVFQEEQRADGPPFDAHSYLLGLRYLTEADATYILEYYDDERGLTEREWEALFTRLESGAPVAEAAAAGRPNAGRRYAYLRASQKDAFGWIYFTPALTALVNLADGSYSLTPEATYTGVTNLELRLRLSVLRGRDHTEYGEKPNDSRVELRARYFF